MYLQNIIDQYNEWNSIIHHKYIDFEKAFDNVDRESIWNIIKLYCIQEKTVNILKDMYDGYDCTVQESNAVRVVQDNITWGVRQRCIISPFFFLILIDWMMSEVTNEGCRGFSGICYKYKQESQRATYRTPEYNVPPLIPFSGFRKEVENVTANQRPGRLYLVILIGLNWLKNTNLVEDFEILLPLKFSWILFGGFRGEVENVSVNQRPGRSSCFSYRTEKIHSS